MHLIGNGEVVLGRGRGLERLDLAGQIAAEAETWASKLKRACVDTIKTAETSPGYKEWGQQLLDFLGYVRDADEETRASTEFQRRMAIVSQKTLFDHRTSRPRSPPRAKRTASANCSTARRTIR